MNRRLLTSALLGLMLFAGLSQPKGAWALILGGEGNDPVRDPGWPTGAAEVANLKSRIAWWEGPPFGGGEWHFEFRGDTAAFQAALDALARIQAPERRLTILDGRGRSFWLDSSRKPGGDDAMDWEFVVWQPASFYRLFGSPGRTFLSGSEHYRGEVPTPELIVYVGGLIDWNRVVVPDGIEIADQRLESHGYVLEDGAVLEVRAWDMATLGPIAGAELVIESIEPQPTGGYAHRELAVVAADDSGRMVHQGVLEDWRQAFVRAPGFASRIVTHLRGNEPRWRQFDVRLAKSQRIEGVIVDERGDPVPGATVRIDDLLGPDGRGYPATTSTQTTSDEQGQFVMEGIPEGYGRFRGYSPRHTFVGLGEVAELTEKPVTVRVVTAGEIAVTVELPDAPRGSYIVEVAPEGGSRVGSWGGSAQLDPEGRHTFTNVPPGRYTLSARPNPGSESDRTREVIAEVKAGETAQVTLQAR
ncbi:MAG: carboxypeptidase regulatory-like domain-containing protein [Planctomyces sp.]|nr:carboxypeptidase regulatory-like domain-containing protein [Planctomyces sp.]